MKKRYGYILFKYYVRFLNDRLLYRHHYIFGKENVPKKGSVIFCGNHRSLLDAPIIVVTAPRHVRFFAKEELNKNFIIKFLAFCFGIIFVKRDEKDVQALKESLKALKNGDCLGIFPEGTRNGFEKNDGKVKNGAAYLAIKTGADVIPIGICGSLKPFRKNMIIYGKPVDYSKFKELKKLDKEQEIEASNILKEEILKLAATEVK